MFGLTTAPLPTVQPLPTTLPSFTTTWSLMMFRSASVLPVDQDFSPM